MKTLVTKTSKTMADPGWKFGATVSLQTAVEFFLNGAPLTKMRPFLVPIEGETKAEILSLNETILYLQVNFSIYVTDFDPASYRLESTLLLFLNDTPVPLFVFIVRATHQ